MKIVKINEDLKINIDCIYSLQCQNNDNDILKWEESYNELMQEYYDNPPLLALDNDELYKPEYGETIDNDKLSKYTDELNNQIITIIGEKPQYSETYILILTTGIKVSIDKIIYDALNKVLEKFEIKFEQYLFFSIFIL